MTIELQIHMDELPDGSVAWWAEADQLPGFVAQSSSLRELVSDATHAVRELAAERKLGEVTITTQLVLDEPATFGGVVSYEGNGAPQTSEGDSRAVVSERPELAAV